MIQRSISGLEAQVAGRNAQHIGEVANGHVALQMPVHAVDVIDVGEIDHDDADVVRQGLVHVFFNQDIAAEAVGDAGDGVRAGGQLHLLVILLVVEEEGVIQKNEEKAQQQYGPDGDGEHLVGRVVGQQMEHIRLREDPEDDDRGRGNHQNQLNGLVQTVFFHRNLQNGQKMKICEKQDYVKQITETALTKRCGK